ncbi:hypothetical protein Bca4012_019870 [Brassica carinata]|uniref:Uncharacterized protein n=1 Tax=Brassica carinata TaxID=52824 RepID=A0A8X7WGL4_BRACI|nr:hypothetical protein Bca52824_001723 [Brassica carinata]
MSAELKVFTFLNWCCKKLINPAFVNPAGDFGIVPEQLMLMSKDHNILFERKITISLLLCSNMENSRRVPERPRSFTRKGNSSQFK